MFATRRYHHEYDIKTRKKKNGIGDHITNNKKHKIRWTDRAFLEIEKDWKLRKIKESIYINGVNPSTEIDATKLMNPEKGMEIAECWMEFNPVIRKILRKSTSKGSSKPIKTNQRRKNIKRREK